VVSQAPPSFNSVVLSSKNGILKVEICYSVVLATLLSYDSEVLATPQSRKHRNIETRNISDNYKFQMERQLYIMGRQLF